MKHVFTPDEQISCLSGIFFVTGGFMVEERTLKTAAKEAKLRLKSGFWQKYKEDIKNSDMTMDEVITLASIIEREAQGDHDRKLVSSVFHNRIKSPDYPYLQSCATVQYVLKERKPVLSIADTQIDSPYNTYINKGLPIGPIASPGEESIEAALHPEESNYLFFVYFYNLNSICTDKVVKFLKRLIRSLQGDF